MKNIELYPHNQKTYENIKEMWKTTNRVAAIQATGTGKSYLILKCLSDVLDEHKIVLAPSSYILEQLVKEAGEDISNTVLMTYADLSFDTEEKIKGFNPTLICLDEFHRCGAEQWGLGVQKLLEMYPDAKVLGTSATHIRFLDNNRDMTDELFEGNVAINLGLAEAIVKEILPMPKYISALYTFDEEVNNLKAKVKTSNNNEESKKDSLKEIDLMKNKLDKSKGIPKIFKKHLTTKSGKFVVFCKDFNHLNEMKKIVPDWFKKSKITKKVECYSIYSEYKNGDKELEQFKDNKSEDSVKLLFSINMFNEGIHIKDVDGVILLRPTSSPIIYYQQIGRAMQVKDSGTPLIFDFVNNFDNIGASGFIGDLKEQTEKEISKGNYADKIKERAEKLLSFMIFDEALEIKDLFANIEDRLDLWGNWDFMYEKLVEYKKENGDCNVSVKDIYNKRLGVWVSAQRTQHNTKKLLDQRREKLEEAGFTWQIVRCDDSTWEDRYRELVKYKSMFGDCDIPRDYIQNSFALGRWVSKQREKHYKMSNYRIKKLESIEFSWSINHKEWGESYRELVEYKFKFGDCNVSTSNKEYLKLGRWVAIQRALYKNDKLEEERIDMLERIGFMGALKEEKTNVCEIVEVRDVSKKNIWQEMYSKLVIHKNQYGDCNVRINCMEDLELINWVKVQRAKLQKEDLSETQIKKLNDINFSYNLLKSNWNDMFCKLVEYKNKFGDCKVPCSEKQLINWIATQQKNYKKNILPQERISRLEEIGFRFSFDVLDRQWESKYVKLKEYKEKNGDCNTFKKVDDKLLSAWIGNQRTGYKLGKLSEERINKLEEIGFKWSLQNDVCKIKGVFWSKACNKYVAKLQFNKKPIELGMYPHELDAIKARRDAEIKYFGKSDINLDDFIEDQVS